jgi:hypothetical protein
MPSLLPFLGRTELEVLSIVGSAILIGTHITTITAVKERILLASRYAFNLSHLRSREINCPLALSKTKKTFRQDIRDLWVNIWNLPPVIRQIVRPVLLSANECSLNFAVVVHNPVFVRSSSRLINVSHHLSSQRMVSMVPHPLLHNIIH